MLSVFEEIRIRDYGAQQREEGFEEGYKIGLEQARRERVAELKSILTYLRQQGRENEYIEASINDELRNKIPAEIAGMVDT